MRVKKSSLAIAALFVAIFSVLGCWRGDLSSTTVITSKAGAGTRTYVVNVWKNGNKTPDGKILTDNEYDPDFESGYLKGTNDEIVAKLKSVLPFPGIEIKATETAEKRWFYITFSFSDIEDYNAKLKKLYDAAKPVYGIKDKLDLRGAFIPATLKVEGDNVVFMDSWQSSVIAIDWAWYAVYSDPELFVLTENHGRQIFLYLEPNIVKVGNTEVKSAPNGKVGIAFAELSPDIVNATYKVTGNLR